MKMLMTLLASIVLFVALGATAFMAYGRENTWQLIAGEPDLGPFELQTLVRHQKPNDALLCTPSLCPDKSKADMDLPSYEMSAGEIIQVIDLNMRKNGAIVERVDRGDDPAQSRYVIRSKAMRFPDTNQFQAVELPDGKTGLIAYGRAQIGYSDLGINFQRLVQLIDGLH